MVRPPPDLSKPLHTRTMEMVEAFMRAPLGTKFFFYGGVVTNQRGESTPYVQALVSNLGFTFTTIEAIHVANGIQQVQVQNSKAAPDLQDIELLAFARQMLEAVRDIHASAFATDGTETRH